MKQLQIILTSIINPNQISAEIHAEIRTFPSTSERSLFTAEPHHLQDPKWPGGRPSLREADRPAERRFTAAMHHVVPIHPQPSRRTAARLHRYAGGPAPRAEGAGTSGAAVTLNIPPPHQIYTLTISSGSAGIDRASAVKHVPAAAARRPELPLTGAVPAVSDMPAVELFRRKSQRIRARRISIRAQCLSFICDRLASCDV